jgi:mannose-1-phosphate guanylyltransferase
MDRADTLLSSSAILTARHDVDPQLAVELDRAGDPHLWAIVLAGGEGVRLRSLVKRVCGDERPKQYVPLLGARTLLGQTLDRVGRLVPPERTVVVCSRHHRRYLEAELGGSGAPHLLVQPEDRGTAAGILYPAHWVARRDPAARVAVFPSDHFFLEEDLLLQHLAGLNEFVRARPERLVLLTARPTHPEVEYGWIERGEVVDALRGPEVRRVAAFHEKPTDAQARRYMQLGFVWNTLIFLAEARLLVEAGRRYVPAMSDRLDRIAAFAGTEDEPFAVHQAYQLMAPANFSQAVLEPCPPFLASSALPGITWSDLGTPRRVLELIRRANLAPPWLERYAQPA